MLLHNAIAQYLLYLQGAGFGEKETERKATILRRHLSYALALFHPPMVSTLLGLSELRLYSRGRITANAGSSRLAAAELFVHTLRGHSSDGLSYVTVAAFRRHYDDERADDESGERRRAVTDLLRAVGMEIEIGAIGRTTYDQVRSYLADASVQRGAGYADQFFHWCHLQSLLSFLPPQAIRRVYARVFDADFLGPEGRMWTDRLRSYLRSLSIEKNLSDGGIDFYARKLKIFVGWLDEKGPKTRVSTQTIADFLDEREKRGVGSSTRAKYVYSIRYFFDFLISKGLEKTNPARHLSVKTDVRPEQPILSELEVVRVIEHLEQLIFRNEQAADIRERIIHFRALRDLCLFLLFTLTGVRLSEACGMRIEEIDFTRRAVRIAAKGNRVQRKKHRHILLPDALWRRLTEYFRVRVLPGDGYVWLSASGRPMSIQGANKAIVRRVHEAGIDKQISPHRLRATCASLYVKKGMDPFSLKNLLGHESITTTVEHYARLSDEELRAVWKRTNPLAGIDDE